LSYSTIAAGVSLRVVVGLLIDPHEKPTLLAVDGVGADGALESSLLDERAEVGAAMVWAGGVFRCSYAWANIIASSKVTGRCRVTLVRSGLLRPDVNNWI
jgi:hypothetical protein